MNIVVDIASIHNLPIFNKLMPLLENSKIIFGISLVLLAINVLFFFFNRSEQNSIKTTTSNPTEIERSDYSSHQSYSEAEMRANCTKEIQEKIDLVDRLVKSTANITAEQAQAIARRAGITDGDNYVIGEDILVKQCVEKKKDIWESY